MLAQFTITKAIHNSNQFYLSKTKVGMLAQFTITKAIHNCNFSTKKIKLGWNVSSIYNYESHSQLELGGIMYKVGMLAEFTNTVRV